MQCNSFKVKIFIKKCMHHNKFNKKIKGKEKKIVNAKKYDLMLISVGI